MIKPTLYLHIGVHRTATTSIQAYLLKNKESFLKNNILVPFNTGRHVVKAVQIKNRSLSAEDLSEQILSEVKEKNPNIDKIIFSDEDISETQNLQEQVRLYEGLKKYFDVKVVCFLRRQDLWLESWFLQNIKLQWNQELANISFNDFFQKEQDGRFPWIDYKELTDAWANIFGEENLSLNVFEREYMPEGPTYAFLKSIEAESLFFPDKDAHINESFHPNISEFLRNLNLSSLKGDAARFNIIRHLPRNRKSSTILSPNLQQEIQDRYAESNAYVARKYFNREQLFSTEIKTNYTPWEELKSEETLKLMREIVDPLVLGMAKNMAELQKCNNQLIRERNQKQKEASKNMQELENQNDINQQEYEDLLRKDASRLYHFKKFLSLLFSK